MASNLANQPTYVAEIYEYSIEWSFFSKLSPTGFYLSRLWTWSWCDYNFLPCSKVLPPVMNSLVRTSFCTYMISNPLPDAFLCPFTFSLGLVSVSLSINFRLLSCYSYVYKNFFSGYITIKHSILGEK